MAVRGLGGAESVNKNYFRYHYNVLQAFGVCIDPPTHRVVRIIYNVYAILMVSACFIFYPIFEFIDLYQNFVDIYSATFELTYILSHVIGFWKLGIIFIYRKDIYKYGKNLESGVFVPDIKRGGIKEIEYVNSATRTVDVQATFFYSFLLIMLGLYVLNAMLNNDSIQEYFDPILNETIQRHIRLKPYKSWLPFEAIETPYYEIACFYQVSSDVFFGLFIGGSDSLICAILCHIKAQFLILINSLNTFMDRIETLMKDDGLNANLARYRVSEMENDADPIELFPGYIQQYADRCISDCVSHHQQIIDLSYSAEDTFNYLMLVQFMGSLLLICFQLFQLSVSSLTSYDSFSMILYLILAMYQVLIFCWHGNEIMLVSDRLPQVIYETNWLVTSLSTRRSLMIMMTRAYRPVKMTAGKFAFLSLETFVSIIRGAGSYFMVLRSMNEEE